MDDVVMIFYFLHAEIIAMIVTTFTNPHSDYVNNLSAQRKLRCFLDKFRQYSTDDCDCSAPAPGMHIATASQQRMYIARQPYSRSLADLFFFA